ncbi:MAG: DNA replication/repair protein RecF [Erysipelotrichaceae bacterium]|nr:DNA replication/repair protein RecF [Erysipelotrichaceae bacterium]
MFVKNLTIKNFRNHHYLSYEFSPKMNIIVGANGTGKTNLVEAIYYLSLARSFRTSDDLDLVEKEKDNASIEAKVIEGEISRKIEIIFQNGSKRILVNDKPIAKLSQLSKMMNVILFEPRDVMIFRGSPKDRRNYLDISLSKKSPPYLEYISSYEKVLRERNEILKLEKIDKTLLDINTEMLIKLSGPIVSYRQKYVKDINDILKKIVRALTGERVQVEIHYQPFVDYDSNFKDNAKKAFLRAQESDIRRKVTSTGIHREDFSMTLNGHDIATFGSQGENRMVALALKLSPFFLIEDKDKRPLVILDDVMSELDANHREKLINFLKKFEQVFITATKLEVGDAKTYTLSKKGEIS